MLEAEKLTLPPSVAAPFTLMSPLEAETLTEAVADFDPAGEAEAEALEKLDAEAVPPPLTLTWLEADTDTLAARAGCPNKMRTDDIRARRILHSIC